MGTKAQQKHPPRSSLHEASPSNIQPRWWLLVGLIWVVAISILSTGYRGFGWHHYAHILLQKLDQPNLYPNDPFADTAYSFATVYWYIVHWIGQFIPIPIVLFVLFLANRVLVVYAAYCLLRTAFPNNWLATLGGLMVVSLVPRPLVGAGNPIKHLADQTTLAFACTMLGLNAFVNRRWVQSAIWMGIATSMNLMYAIFGMSYLVATFLVDSRFRREWRSILSASPLGLLLGLPGILLVATEAARPVENVRAVWQASELNYAEHFFMGIYPFWIHAIVVGLFLVALWMARCGASPSDRLMGAWTAVGVGWYLLAWLNPLLIHSLPLLHLHPIRGHDLWVVLVGLYWAGKAAEWISVQTGGGMRGIATVSFVLSVATLWNVMLPPSPLRLGAALATWVGVWGGSIAFYWLRRTWSPGVAYALMAVCLTGLAIARHIREVNYLRQTDSRAVAAIAAWAQQHTSREDVFLIPLVDMGCASQVAPLAQVPMAPWNLFRAMAQRNVFVTWLDGSGWTYAPWYAATWIERMRALGLHETAGLEEKTYQIGSWAVPYLQNMERFRETYLRLNDARVQQLKSSYRIDYWVVPEWVDSAFPVVYRYGCWKVLRVQPNADTASRSKRARAGESRLRLEP